MKLNAVCYTYANGTIKADSTVCTVSDASISHDETLYAERALRAGAMGYMMKQEASEMVIAGIRRVLEGEICLSEKMASRIISRNLSGRLRSGSSDSRVELLSDPKFAIPRDYVRYKINKDNKFEKAK